MYYIGQPEGTEEETARLVVDVAQRIQSWLEASNR
jgi:hypothetical protein